MRLIDANALREKATLRHGYDFQGVFVKVQDIDAAPTVDAVEVVHGRWCFMGTWEECSICGHAIAVDDPYTNYCPNCGAKMDLKG